MASADMMLRYDNGVAQERVAASLPVLRELNQLRGVDFRPAPPGDLNAVLMGGTVPETVVKLPLLEGNKAYRSVWFEGEVVAHLSEVVKGQSPLAVPELIDCRWQAPCHLVLTKVPGEVLSHAAVRNFDAAQQHHFGHDIGEFVVRMSNAISPELCATFALSPSDRIQPDRVHNIHHYYNYALENEDLGDGLSEVLIETYNEMRELQRLGQLEPTIVGHDDLRPGNFTFKKSDDKWMLHGVFDFGLTKLSSPEREFRHIAPLGPTVVQAATQAYEAETGQTIRPRLLQFWAVGQAATAAASLKVHNNPSGLAERVYDLRQLLPDKDWSYLDDCVTSARDAA